MQKGETSVFKTLRLMSLDDVRQMTASHEVQKAVDLPMAAGAEFTQWDAPPRKMPEKQKLQEKEAESFEGKVLHFPEKIKAPVTSTPKEAVEGGEDELELHREMFRVREDHHHMKDGVELYRKTTSAHMMRASKEKGSKLKFASTNGVLINKKQD